MEDQLSLEQIKNMFANPFYAINIHPDMALPHVTIIDRKTWIAAAKKCIEETGLEDFLERLLNNLEGKS